MKTRREMAMVLLSLPLVAKAMEPEATTTGPAATPEAGPRPVPPPRSVDAANIVSYTIYAEARGETFAGKMAVASVIKTRATRSGLSLIEVCMQDRQFSCWNGLKAVPDFYLSGEGIDSDDLHARTECFGIAWVLMTSKRKWDSFTHFYNPDKATPEWAFELRGTRTIGNHVFGRID